MGKIWQPRDPEILKTWHQTILDEASDDLTDWESNFIESIGNSLSRGWTLSERQEQILERIYAEKTK